MILIFLYPNDALLWLYNVHKIGKRPADGLLTVTLTSFLFSLTLSMCFFSKEVRNVLSISSFKKCSGFNRIGTLGKTIY